MIWRIVGAGALMIGAFAVLIAYGNRLREPKRSRVIYGCLAVILLGAYYSYFQFFYIPDKINPLREEVRDLEEDNRRLRGAPAKMLPANTDSLIANLRKKIESKDVEISGLKNEIDDSTGRIVAMSNIVVALQRENRVLERQIGAVNAPSSIEESSNAFYTVSIITSEENNHLREGIEKKLYCWGFKIEKPVAMSVDENELYYHTRSDEKKARAIAEAIKKDFRINLEVRITENNLFNKLFRIKLR